MHRAGGRLSNTPNKRRAHDQAEIADAHKACASMLQILATKIDKNEEKVPQEHFDKWKNDIMDQFTTLSQNKVTNDWLADNIANSIQKGKAEIGTTNYNEFLNFVMKDINDKKEANSSHFQVDGLESVKKMRRTLFPDEAAEDEDFVVMEGTDEEAKFKCPITIKIMDVPMRCPTCQNHRVSKAAWEGSLKRHAKNGRVPCPIAGCKKSWNVADVEVDEEFYKELQRYNRRKAIRDNLIEGSGPASSSTADAFEIE
eukprot:gene43459-53133_t